MQKKTIGEIFGAIIALVIAQLLAQLVASLFVLVKVPNGICNIIAGILYIGFAFVMLKLFSKKLNIRSMANHRFGNGKATLDNGYGMFLNMLEYKLADRNKYFIKCGLFSPSQAPVFCFR